MGNEALRSSRHSTASSPIRRSSRRQSKNANSNNGGQNYTAEDDVDRNNQEFGQTPKPVRRMDKIRRSLSFRRKKKSDKRPKLQQQQSADVQTTSLTANLTTSASAPLTSSSSTTTNAPPANHHSSTANNTSSTTATNATTTSNMKSNSTVTTNNQANESSNSSTTKPPLWLDDEKRVRAGNCSFQVKYLGSVEVTDSRGMHLCEMAIEKLLAEKEKKKPIKAILYVSGDSLRVVDESNKTLIVDQTIEKVSFCAPDRHHENGFAYICRDGTTRRWLCHCFMAIKDTLKGSAGTGSSGGERLSHAVGCAFSVCLERKQKRERENVSMEVGPNHSFTRLGSFRQASITERLEDPQIVMPAADPVPIKAVDNPHAIERPKPNPDAFNRQNSLRGTGALQMPFKRNMATYKSLKPGELPSFQQQKLASGLTSASSASAGGAAPVTKTSLLMQQHQQQKMNSASTPPATPASVTNGTPLAANLNPSDPSNLINTISELPEEQFASQPEANNSTKFNQNVSAASTANQLNEQFSNQLNFNSNEQTASNTTMNAHQLDWSSLSQQQQSTGPYYQVSSSVFATPQSLPVTPTTNGGATTNGIGGGGAAASPSPPPLPPLPAQYATATPMMYQTTPLQQQAMYYHSHQYPVGTPMMQMMPPTVHMPLQQQLNMMGISAAQLHSSSGVYTTPLGTPAMMMMAGSPAAALTSASMSSTSGGVNSNETFEQKWARIQAAKKTNPFAEDIAKKFEIKL